MAFEVTTIPENVRSEIRSAWPHGGSNEPDKVQLAARHAVCWFLDEATDLGKTDNSAVVDYSIQIGMIAERVRNDAKDANTFIKAVEKEVLCYD